MIPLFKPFIPNELPLLDDIFKSGQLSHGQYSNRFEEILKHYFKQSNLIITNSYSSAISIVASVLGLKYGDEVILSPMACLVSTQSFASLGLKIIWADIDSKTGTLDPSSVRLKISSKTKCIVHNHFGGYSGYIDEINEIGRINSIPIIDDCIESFGSEYKGKKIGTCGTDITIFSFSPVRIPNTIEGGAVIFKNQDQFAKSLLVRDNGIDRDKFRDELGEINPSCDISTTGFTATMSNINGYIGCLQMEHVERLINIQRNNALKWTEIISSRKDMNPVLPINGRPNYWVFGILTKDKQKAIIEFRKQGYYASSVHYPNNNYSIFGKNIRLKGVEEFHSNFLALPSGWWVKI